MKQVNESFGHALRWRFLPFAPICFVLAAERSAWFLAALPISVAAIWFQTRHLQRSGMMKQVNESFGHALRWRFLPFAPIFFVLAAERSAWFLVVLPIGVAAIWFQTRHCHG